jgi:hypothetical protein
MRRSVLGTVLLVALALVTASSTAGAQTPAPNQIVVHAAFGAGAPPATGNLAVHVLCANEGGSPVVTVVDQTVTLSAPWDPVAVEVPVLESGGSSTFVGCEVMAIVSPGGGEPVGYTYACSVADPGTPPPPDAPVAGGCGPLRSRVDAFFPATVSGATYDVTVTVLRASPAPTETAPVAVAAAPLFTG